MTYVVLLMTLGIAIAALVQIFTDPRIDRPFIVKSLVALIGFGTYCAIGFLVMIALAARTVVDREALSFAVVLFYLFWIAEGMLWLLRTAPRLRQIPKWIDERSYWLDVAILTASGLALVAALMIEN